MGLCMGGSQLSVICTCGSTLAVGWMNGGMDGRKCGQPYQNTETFSLLYTHTYENTRSGVTNWFHFTCLIQVIRTREVRGRVANTHVYMVSMYTSE